MDVKVSVIVPVYNVEKYLDRCIESLLKQSLKEIEIILIDDGSPDKCPMMCDKYAKMYENIVVIHKQNAGLGMARNSGMEIARGEYIAFVDSDDYVDEDMCYKLYNVAKNNKAEIVIAGSYYSESDCKKTQITSDTNEEMVFTGEDTRLLALYMTGSLPDNPLDVEYAMCVWKGIYSKQLIEQYNIHFVSERELISEDLIFHYDILQYAQKVTIVPGCFYHYCLNNESLTKVYNKERFCKNIQLYDYVTKLLKKRGYPKDSKIYAERLMLARTRVCIEQIVKHYGVFHMKTRQEILNICNNEVLTEILKNYPIYKLPIKQRIFTYMIKFRLYIGMSLLIKLNNLIKD